LSERPGAICTCQEGLESPQYTIGLIYAFSGPGGAGPTKDVAVQAEARPRAQAGLEVEKQQAPEADKQVHPDEGKDKPAEPAAVADPKPPAAAPAPPAPDPNPPPAELPAAAPPAPPAPDPNAPLAGAPVFGPSAQYTVAFGFSNPLEKPKPGMVESVGFSPDGKRIIGAGHLEAHQQMDVIYTKGVVRSWDLGTGNEVEVLPKDFKPNLDKYTSASIVYAGYFADNRSSFVVLEGGGVFVCDPQGGKQPRQFRLPPGAGDPRVLAFDGRNALVNTVNGLVVCDMETGRVVRPLVGHTRTVRGAAFLPGGKQALSLGEDRVLYLWDLTTGKSLKRHEFEAEPRGFAQAATASGLSCSRTAAGSMSGTYAGGARSGSWAGPSS